MKRILVLSGLMLLAGAAGAQQYVQGYTTANGQYVQGYYRTAPNNTRTDNYSSQGNVNPYTGQQGTQNPYAQPQQSSYAPNPPPQQYHDPADARRSSYRPL